MIAAESCSSSPMRLWSRFPARMGYSSGRPTPPVPIATAGTIPPLDVCPSCGGWMPEGWNICDNCCHALKARFVDFITDLEPAERRQLDTWLEGASVEDCETFE